jgi:gas vesicle protein
MSSEKVVLSALAGLATGVILGILFAPEKGKDTRKKIAKKRKDSMEDMKSKYEGIIESLSDRYEKEKKECAYLFQEHKNKAEEAKKL